MVVSVPVTSVAAAAAAAAVVAEAAEVESGQQPLHLHQQYRMLMDRPPQLVVVVPDRPLPFAVAQPAQRRERPVSMLAYSEMDCGRRISQEAVAGVEDEEGAPL